jgi:hypothetical protein
MTSQLAPPVQLQVNLAVVRGHYADALKRHFRRRALASQYRAIRAIPLLVSEVERLWALVDEAMFRYANLRAATVTALIAYDTSEADPFSHLRAALSAGDRRVHKPATRDC